MIHAGPQTWSDFNLIVKSLFNNQRPAKFHPYTTSFHLSEVYIIR